MPTVLRRFGLSEQLRRGSGCALFTAVHSHHNAQPSGKQASSRKTKKIECRENRLRPSQSQCMGRRDESQNLTLAHQLAHKFLTSERPGGVQAVDGPPASRKLPSRGVQLEGEARVADQTARGAGLEMNAMLIEAAPGENKRAVPGERVAALQLSQRAATSTVASFPGGALEPAQDAKHDSSCPCMELSR